MSAQASARALSKRAAVASWSLVLLIVASLLSIATSAEYGTMLADLRQGADVTYDEAVAADDRMALAGIGLLVGTVVSAISFIVWFRRAWITQLEHGDQNLRFSRGWTIGAWFVPILNLWRPKQMANDLWRGTEPGSELGASDRPHGRRLGPLIGLWWAAWIISGIIGNVAAASLFQAQTLSEQEKANDLGMVTDALTVAGAVVAIVFIAVLTRRQEQRFAEPPPAFAPPVAQPA